MDAQTLATVTAEIDYHAERFARVWWSTPADDFRQEGWAIVLEALPRYDATKASIRTYVSRILGRSLHSFACRSAQPVKTPKNNEHRYHDRAQGVSVDAITETIDPYPQPDTLVEIDQVACIIREAVAAATADEPALVGFFLGDATKPKLVAEHGGTVQAWDVKVRKAKAKIRTAVKL